MVVAYVPVVVESHGDLCGIGMGINSNNNRCSVFSEFHEPAIAEYQRPPHRNDNIDIPNAAHSRSDGSLFVHMSSRPPSCVSSRSSSGHRVGLGIHCVEARSVSLSLKGQHSGVTGHVHRLAVFLITAFIPPEDSYTHIPRENVKSSDLKA